MFILAQNYARNAVQSCSALHDFTTERSQKLMQNE